MTAGSENPRALPALRDATRLVVKIEKRDEELEIEPAFLTLLDPEQPRIKTTASSSALSPMCAMALVMADSTLKSPQPGHHPGLIDDL